MISENVSLIKIIKKLAYRSPTESVAFLDYKKTIDNSK